MTLFCSSTGPITISYPNLGIKMASDKNNMTPTEVFFFVLMNCLSILVAHNKTSYTKYYVDFVKI